MRPLQIHLFQSLRVYAGADLLTDLGYPRQHNLALLTYLLLHRGQSVPRAHLAFVLWPDASEAEAIANLRRALHSLRRALPTPSDPSHGYVLADRQSVRWNPLSDYWLDVEEFEARLTQRTPAALEQAAGLYTGDLLEESYDDWVLPERERLRARYLGALGQLIVYHRSQRAFAQAIARAQQLLARDPLHEKTHQQLIALLYLSGDRSGALRQYDKCREALRRELAVEPVEETRALQERILRGETLDEPPDTRTAARPDSGPATTPSLRPHPGPAGIMPPLVGREAEQAWLAGRWNAAEAGQGSLIFIQGEAGVGKTRLASELVERIQGRASVLAGGGHASEQLLPYHPLVEALRRPESRLADQLESAVANPDSRWWLAEVALLLPELRERWPQLQPASTREAGPARLRLLEGLTRCLLALAARQPLLIILDDLHWADEATMAWLEYVSRQVRPARVLIVGTYRSEEETPALAQTRLALTHEGLFQELRLNRLSTEAVAQLIQHMTGSAGQAINFSRLLFRETEGNPLFLVETLRALFEAGFLRQGAQGWQADWDQAAESAGLPLPATIREAIRSRLRRLSEMARQVLEAASVVGRRFDDRAAWQASGRSEEEGVTALEEALRAQLIAEHEGDYRFTHDKIQEVAYSDLSAARRRLLHRRVAESLEGRQRNRSEVAGQLAYHYDRAEVWDRVAPQARAAAERAKHIYASSEALAYYDLALKALARLTDRTVDDGQRLAVLVQRFDILSGRHGTWTLVGQFEQAKADLEEMVALAREMRDDARLSDALNGLGYHFMNLGQPAEAREPLVEALAVKRRLNDRPGQIDSLNTLGTAYVILGEVALGIAAFAESRTLCQALGDDDALARSEWAAGAAVYEGIGEYERAIGHLQRALELSRKLRNRALECGSLLMIGAASVRLGDEEAGRAHLNQALNIARQIGDRPAEGWGLLYLSWADRESGQYEAGLERGQQALAIGRELKADFLSWYAWHSLARLYLLLNRLPDSLEVLNQAHQISQGKTFPPSTLARTLAALARAHMEMGQAEDSQRYTREALSELQSLRAGSLPDTQAAYFDCYLALQRSAAPGAAAALERAYAAMTAQAEAIPDPKRRTRFLHQVSVNREITAAWESRRNESG